MKQQVKENKNLSIPFIRGGKQMKNRVATWADRVACAIGTWLMTSICSFNAYAGGLGIDTNISVGNLDDFNAEGAIIGIAIWVCRMIGIAMIIWGIYGYVTARKDGEAESMNGAIGKLVAGAVLISMKSILGLIGILG